MRIGIFDSGLGGLHVFQQIVKRLPQYDYVFLADAKNLPYGTKSSAQIYRLTKAGVQFLFEKDCALVILACNTASTQALRRLQQQWLPKHYSDRRVLGITVPTIENITNHRGKIIGVLATPSTIRSKVFQKEIKKRYPGTQVVTVAAPQLVTAIESANPQQMIKVLQAPIQKLQRCNIEKIILACTHFGLIQKEIKALLGKKIQVIVPAKELPKQLTAYLSLHPEIQRKLEHHKMRAYFTTSESKKYTALVKKWFNKKLPFKEVRFTIS
jgi:glutamate racemase